MNKNKPRILLSILAVALIQLACTIFVGGPAYPANQIAVSTEAINSLNQQLQVAQTAAAQSGTLTLTINEAQITSLLANYLNSQPDPFIQNPQVTLRNGEIQVYGQVSKGNFEANVRIVLTASVDAEGNQVIKVSSTDFGPFPAPKGLDDTVSALITQAFTGSFGPAATGLRLDSIQIADGSMTISGRVK